MFSIVLIQKENGKPAQTNPVVSNKNHSESKFSSSVSENPDNKSTKS